MDYQKFVEELPKLYENWGKDFLQPKANKFAEVLERIEGMTTANVMQLLNFAVECIEEDEIYCEVGCYQGSTLIGALLDHSHQLAYAVDNFTEFDTEGGNQAKLAENLAQFNLNDRVLFCNQDFEEFFFDLKKIDPTTKIGVYLYDGAHDYRSQMLGLLLVKPFLAPRALIIVDDSNWSCVKQANCDFIAAHPECQLLLDLPTAKNKDRSFWNGIQVLSWNINRPKIQNWESFSENFRDRNIIKAICDLHFEFESNKKPEVVQNLYSQADQLIDAGDLETAEKKYLEALKWQPNNSYLWHDLGMFYFKKLRYQDALSMLIKSLNLDGTKGLPYYSMGLIQEGLGNYTIARQFYQKAIKLDEKFVNPYLNLGNLLVASEQLSEAESIYRQALSVAPKMFAIHANLGNILMELENFSEAKEYYQRSLKLQPNEPDIIHKLKMALRLQENPKEAHWLLGQTALKKNKYDRAIAHFQKYLENYPDDIDCFFFVAFCYDRINKFDKVVDTLKRGMEYHPDKSLFYIRLSLTLQKMGYTKEAQKYVDRAAELFPDNLAVQLQRQQILPIIYNSKDEIDWYRDRFVKNLDRLLETTPLDDEEGKKNGLMGISNTTNFYLNYQGKDDLELHKKYGQLVARVMAANYPDLVKPLSIPPLGDGEKIRVGYVCSCFRLHSVSKLFLGWLENHDKEKFEINCYYADFRVDQITAKYKLASKSFYHNPISWNQIDRELKFFCEKIFADKLHVLVFLDIGMLALIHAIAGLRLAPIQCQTWAHPITSGIPTIDYFLSSDLMEPENAQSHYAETLIRLPNLGVCYTKPSLPKNRKQRSDFQLPEEAIIYLCCQSIFKYLPQYDYIFAAIAKEVPTAKFAFLSRSEAGVMEQFKGRLQKAFAQFDLDSEQHCIMLPKLNFSDYLNLNLVSDIFLDSFAWSGGVTTMEATACNLPVVTCPGEFMRGRHAYGILRMLGVRETIAADEKEYIEIAVRLGKNPDLRKSIVEKIKNNHSRLYGDLTCVRAVEEFYQRVVREYLKE